MEETKLFKFCPLVTILLIYLLFFNGTAKSEVYTVGDSDQWNSGTNYLTWSAKYNFSVGDILVFKYVKGQNNTYEVTEKTYQSCDARSGVLAKYESGNDEVKLTEAKKYWFICDTDGHCLGGMRFFIDVKEASSVNASSIPPTQPPPPPQSDNNSASQRRCLVIYLLALLSVLLDG